MERTLARSAEAAPKSLSELVLSGREIVLPEVIDPAGSTAEEGVNRKDGEEKKGPGSVSVSLGGGSLTGYSYSTTGLDFTGWSMDGGEEEAAGADADGGLGLKLMLRDESIDLESMEKDGNMRNSFSGSNREWFYEMESYEQFADLFEDEEETKDYSVTGVGLEFNLGAYELGVMNYSKPPERKSIVFFGNETEGPYKIRATNIIPGSEIVRIDGSEVKRGSAYEIVYSKGEITFTTTLSMDRRVVVEYEVAQGSGGEPGKFTGFRFQSAAPEKQVSAAGEDTAEQEEAGESAGESDSLFKWGPLSAQKWGVTYLTDTVISYERDGSQVLRSETEHSLMGVDGAMSLWGNTTLGFEAAKSSGSKNRELGRYANQEFTIADTAASDMNPLGPYNLDEDKLPVKEGSDEVRLNGELLVRDEDYTLDPEYGTLRIKNEDLNLSSLDVIAIEYRYIDEADELALEDDSKDGLAGLVSMDNEIKGVKHHYSVERRSADFMLVGGKSGNQLKTEKQDVSWSGGSGLSLAWGRTHNETLQDYVTGLVRTNEGHNFSADYKADAFSVAFKTDEKDQSENKTGGAESEKQNRSITASYKFNDNYNLSLSDTTNDGTDLRSGSVATTYSSARNYTLDAKPMEKLKCTFKTGTGKSGNTSSGTTRDSVKNDRSISMKYDPSKKWSLQYDNTQSDVSNSAYSTTSAVSATDTVSTGNSAIKWRMQYKPDDKTTLMYRNNSDQQDQANGRTEKTQKYYDVRRKFGDDIDFQFRRSALNSHRPNQEQQTDVDNFTVRLSKPWFDGTDITLKHNRQNSQTERTGQSSTSTNSGSTANTISVGCSPFWEERKFSLEYSLKDSTQTSTGQDATGDTEKKWKAEFEIPFIKESYWAVTREQSKKSGRRSTGTERLEISLNGEVFTGLSLQVSYSSDKFSDPENPQTNRTDSAFNVVLKGEREWR